MAPLYINPHFSLGRSHHSFCRLEKPYETGGEGALRETIRRGTAVFSVEFPDSKAFLLPGCLVEFYS